MNNQSIKMKTTKALNLVIGISAALVAMINQQAFGLTLPVISTADSGPGSLRDTLAADKSLCSDFVLALLDEGVLALPDGRWYVSAAHSDEDIDATLAAAERIVQ